MSTTSDSQDPAAVLSVQDAFLNLVRREQVTVSVRLMDGTDFEGRIKNFDRFSVVVEQNGGDYMIFKHAIATISSPRAVSNYYASPGS